MHVLILGSGGREHALAWKVAQSPRCSHLYIAPGNGGTAACGENVSLSLTDFPAIAAFIRNKNIRGVIVGPEDPLVRGLHDYLVDEADLKDVWIVGPRKQGAELEGSKAFSKAFMQRHEIPTAAYARFDRDSLEAGHAFLEKMAPPYVLKADGLAAGKGVLILNDLQEAQAELTAMIEEAKFGDASAQVVIEEYLKGIELSVFVYTDGQEYVILPEAKDYKRIGEGDTGLNTGGMGAISPVHFADAAFMAKVEERIVAPSIRGLQSEGIPYQGFLFIGLMNVQGDPYVIEYNVRMGDPETEVVLPRIQSDLIDLFEAGAAGRLSDFSLEVDPRYATTVILVSGGYPQAYEKGKTITVASNGQEQTLCFHAGTKQQGEELVTSGGRVMALTSYGNSMQEALAKSYETARHIDFDGMYYRTDIGFDL